MGGQTRIPYAIGYLKSHKWKDDDATKSPTVTLKTFVNYGLVQSRSEAAPKEDPKGFLPLPYFGLRGGTEDVEKHPRSLVMKSLIAPF